jgi:DNA repair ATPase RecN
MALFSSDKSVEMKPIGSSDTIEGLISSLGRKVDEPLELSNTLLENSTKKINDIKQQLGKLSGSVKVQNKAVDDLAQKTIDLQAMTDKNTALDKEIIELRNKGSTSHTEIKKLEEEKKKLEGDVKMKINNIIKKVDGNKSSLTANQTSISKLFGDLESEITTLQSSVKTKGNASVTSVPNKMVNSKSQKSTTHNKQGINQPPMKFGGKGRRTRKRRRNSHKKRSRKH